MSGNVSGFTESTVCFSENTPLNRKRRTWRNLAAFWILGLCNNYGYVVMLTAANDIIVEQEGGQNVDNSTRSGNPERDCNYMSTGAILLADILPCLIVKLIFPYLPLFINLRMACCVLLAAASYVLVAFSSSTTMSLAGVALTSFCSGLGEITLLQFSSFYNKNVVSTWSSGTGAAGVVGALSYTILKKLGLRNALLVMLIVPFLMAAAFWLILTKPSKHSSYIKTQRQIMSEDVKTPLKAFAKKLKLVPGLLRFMVPLGLVYFFEYFINQGTFELIKFDNIFIDTDAQYRWLQVDYQIGVFLSRSSVNLFHIRHIWVMSILQLINVAIFTTEAIFYYTPSFWIILALTLWEGLLGGAAYVNTFYRISSEVSDEDKQFSMATTSFADTIGITFAGIAAIAAHNKICDLPKPTRF